MEFKSTLTDNDFFGHENNPHKQRELCFEKELLIEKKETEYRDRPSAKLRALIDPEKVLPLYAQKSKCLKHLFRLEKSVRKEKSQEVEQNQTLRTGVRNTFLDKNQEIQCKEALDRLNAELIAQKKRVVNIREKLRQIDFNKEDFRSQIKGFLTEFTQVELVLALKDANQYRWGQERLGALFLAYEVFQSTGRCNQSLFECLLEKWEVEKYIVAQELAAIVRTVLFQVNDLVAEKVILGLILKRVRSGELNPENILSVLADQYFYDFRKDVLKSSFENLNASWWMQERALIHLLDYEEEHKWVLNKFLNLMSAGKLSFCDAKNFIKSVKKKKVSSDLLICAWKACSDIKGLSVFELESIARNFEELGAKNECADIWLIITEHPQVSSFNIQDAVKKFNDLLCHKDKIAEIWYSYALKDGLNEYEINESINALKALGYDDHKMQDVFLNKLKCKDIHPDSMHQVIQILETFRDDKTHKIPNAIVNGWCTIAKHNFSKMPLLFQAFEFLKKEKDQISMTYLVIKRIVKNDEYIEFDELRSVFDYVRNNKEIEKSLTEIVLKRVLKCVGFDFDGAKNAICDALRIDKRSIAYEILEAKVAETCRSSCDVTELNELFSMVFDSDPQAEQKDASGNRVKSDIQIINVLANSRYSNNKQTNLDQRYLCVSIICDKSLPTKLRQKFATYLSGSMWDENNILPYDLFCEFSSESFIEKLIAENAGEGCLLIIAESMAVDPLMRLKALLGWLQKERSSLITENIFHAIDISTKKPQRAQLEYLQQIIAILKSRGSEKALASAQSLLLKFKVKLTQNTPINNTTQFKKAIDYAEYGFVSARERMGEPHTSENDEASETGRFATSKLISYIKTHWPDNESIEEPSVLKLGDHTINIQAGKPTSASIGFKKISAGILLVEPDGRIWLRKVTNGYGGYSYDFAKGTYEEKESLTLQQTAIKELYEETGFEGAILGFSQDQERGSNITRFYFGRRTGGSPADSGWETEHMVLVDASTARELLKGNKNDCSQRVIESLVKEGRVVENSPPGGAPVGRGYAPLLSSYAKWPELRSLVFVSDLPGSTGPKLYQDKTTGKKYVIKRGAHSAHAYSEFIANQAYEALGVRVPQAKFFEKGMLEKMGNAPYVMLEYLEESKPYGKWLVSASENQKTLMKSKIEEGFAADALLGNWDVCGNMDNILIYNNEPYRIDVGGALFFRAQGERKGIVKSASRALDREEDAFNKYPTDFWSLRGKKVPQCMSDGRIVSPENKHGLEFFGNINIYQLADQIIEIDRLKVVLMAHLPEKINGIEDISNLKRTIGLRLYYMRELMNQAKVMQADGWSADYVDEMLMHRMLLRLHIKRLIPKNLVQTAVDQYNVNELDDPTNLEFGNKKPFGGMHEREDRAGSSVPAREVMSSYFDLFSRQAKGRDIMQIIISGPGNSSHSPFDIVWKLFLAKQRNGFTEKDFYWNLEKPKSVGGEPYRNANTLEEISSIYLSLKGISLEDFEFAAKIQHAYTQEILCKTDFKFNNRKMKTVELVRTVELLGGKDKDTVPQGLSETRSMQEIRLETAVYESTSIFHMYRAERGKGYLLMRSVPHHRILVPYFVKKWHSGGNPISEFVAMTHEIPVHTIAPLGEAADQAFKKHLGDSVNPPEYFSPKVPKDLGLF